MKTLGISVIDIRFDVRSDSGGRDPDCASPTLRRYHKTLWSKPLPSGELFSLDDNSGDMYLLHRSKLSEYPLSSDSIVHTYSKWKRMQHIITRVPEGELDDFLALAHTVGGYLIFPCNKVNGLHTINQERGRNKFINDRIDLTLECIRLFYNAEESPMTDTLKRYTNFFSLFCNFKGYCEFFLLQDLVSDDFSRVNFFLPFLGFELNPLPKDLDEYSLYRRHNVTFVLGRNKKISEFSLPRTVRAL